MEIAKASAESASGARVSKAHYLDSESVDDEATLDDFHGEVNGSGRAWQKPEAWTQDTIRSSTKELSSIASTPRCFVFCDGVMRACDGSSLGNMLAEMTAGCRRRA